MTARVENTGRRVAARSATGLADWNAKPSLEMNLFFGWTSERHQKICDFTPKFQVSNNDRTEISWP